MYQPVFDDNIDDGELSPLENFISLNDIIRAGGIKADRAKRILNQFSSNSTSKVPKNSFNQETTSNHSFKKPRYSNNRRFKT